MYRSKQLGSMASSPVYSLGTLALSRLQGPHYGLLLGDKPDKDRSQSLVWLLLGCLQPSRDVEDRLVKLTHVHRRNTFSAGIRIDGSSDSIASRLL